MGDVLDFMKRRSELREAVEVEKPDGTVLCPECGDMLSMVAAVPGYTVDGEGPYALICQHCSEPWGTVYLFPEDLDIEEE